MRRDLRDHPERQETRETKAAEASRAHTVRLARRERMVCQVLMEKMAHLVFQGSRAALARLGCLVLLVLREQRDCLAAQGQKVELDLRARLDLGVTLACLVPPDLWASLVFLVRVVWKEFLDLRVTEASEERLGHRELSASLELKEREDQSVFQVPRVLAEPWETRASKEKLAQRETMVTPVLRDWLARKVIRVCLVNPGLKDSKELGATPDTTDPRETLVNLETWDHQDCPVLGDSMESEEYPASRAFRAHPDAIHLTSTLSKWC